MILVIQFFSEKKANQASVVLWKISWAFLKL